METGPRFYDADPSPEKDDEAAKSTLERHYFTQGDVDVEGVSDEVKERFIADKLRQNEAKMAKLREESAQLEKLRARLSPGFSEDEEAWFAGGEAAARRLALQEYWESDMSLDIEDIPASEKVAFADDRLRQLKYLAGTEQFRLSDGLRDRIQRLELLRDQYAKEAEQEKGAAA
ncbi:MAG TPA: hypothetical protein VL500_04680 [Candidatus Eisenbacteria bacterium]|jgi:hypothetical protein|nr:hypothetical protein [Candidatus Eisenbacteria bacterium]